MNTVAPPTNLTRQRSAPKTTSVFAAQTKIVQRDSSVGWKADVSNVCKIHTVQVVTSPSVCKTSVRCVRLEIQRLVRCQMYVARGSVSVRAGESGRIAKYLIVDSVSPAKSA